jgi:NADH-quinone oxidoreductase subunit C
VSTIAYTATPPAALAPAIASTLAALGAQWCDYSTCGAAAKYRSTPAVLLPLDAWPKAFEALKTRHGFDLLVDHSAVDYPDRDPRFTLVGIVENTTTCETVLLKTHVSEGAPAPTLTHLWKSADWAERETFDMFGIPFTGHPDLTRIYMPQEYDGWPMRRDFPLEGHLKFRD